MSGETIEAGTPSAFFRAHLDALVHAARDQPLLDLACGRGRHALAAARAGLRVMAVDRNREALEKLSRVELRGPGSIETVMVDLEAVDLESSATPKLPCDRFAAIVVTRYLHRPLMPWIEALLAPGGLLLYETFLVTQRALGWGPTRTDFLLEAGELPRLFPNLETRVHEEGPSRDDPPAETARLLARRPG
jgi:SAM-dependent methyltransferase